MKKFLGIVALLGVSTAANASITVFLDSNTVNAAGTEQTFVYRAEQTAGDTFLAADYFTIYDFGGFISATAAPGFTYTTQNVGQTPASQLVTDNPNLTNITFRATSTTSASVISPFTLVSSYVGPLVSIQFSGRNHKETLGTANEANGDVSGPSSAIPEPATMGLMGGALLGLGLFARRRK
jgi:hypothetical protein